GTWAPAGTTAVVGRPAVSPRAGGWALPTDTLGAVSTTPANKHNSKANPSAQRLNPRIRPPPPATPFARRTRRDGRNVEAIWPVCKHPSPPSGARCRAHGWSWPLTTDPPLEPAHRTHARSTPATRCAQGGPSGEAVRGGHLCSQGAGKALPGLAVPAPEPHRTTQWPPLNRSTEPAICARFEGRDHGPKAAGPPVSHTPALPVSELRRGFRDSSQRELISAIWVGRL